MKKIIMFLILIFFTVSSACAHPPSDMKITYDLKARVLKAVIMHNVSDSKKHFIREVDIGLNGKNIISHAISRQDDIPSQTVIYRIPDARIGDVLSVEAYCSISGKLKKEIKVEK